MSRAILRRLRRSAAVVAISVLVSSYAAAVAGAQACDGDCDGNGELAVSELVGAVRIALGTAPLSDCQAADVDGSGAIGIDDLLRAVTASLGPCSPRLTADGVCMQPGTTGLAMCDPGMAVRVFRCNDAARCLTERDDPTVLTTLAFGNIGVQGNFSLSFRASEAGSAPLVFEAQIDATTTYRVISFGLLGTGGGSGVEITMLLLAPSSEAAVRLLAENGFENFAPDAVLDVIDAVADANDTTSFAGLAPEAAAALATNEARTDPQVIAVIQASLQTPTPTATRTPTPTAPPGGRAGAEFLVNSYTLRDQDDPRLASNGSRVVAVWTRDEPPSAISDAIVARVFDATGAAVAPEFRVDTFTIAANTAPDVGMDPAGNFVVVWQNLGLGVPEAIEGIIAQRFDSAGVRRGSEFQVDSSNRGYPSGPRIAVEPSGDFVVVWQGDDGAVFGLFGQRFESTGAKVGTEFQVNAFTLGRQSDPAVVAVEGGEFGVVWTSEPSGYEAQDGDLGGVFGQAFDSAGNRDGKEFQVNAYTVGSQSRPAVLALADGFVVLWESAGQDGDAFGVFAQGFDTEEQREGPEVQINTFTLGSQQGITATLTEDSRVVVVWETDDPTGRDGSDEAIFGQMFDGNGARDGAEFQINAFTVGDQDSPAIAATSDGFVVVWESSDQDGDETGIFGRRFRIAP